MSKGGKEELSKLDPYGEVGWMGFEWRQIDYDTYVAEVPGGYALKHEDTVKSSMVFIPKPPKPEPKTKTPSWATTTCYDSFGDE